MRIDDSSSSGFSRKTNSRPATCSRLRRRGHADGGPARHSPTRSPPPLGDLRWAIPSRPAFRCCARRSRASTRSSRRTTAGVLRRRGRDLPRHARTPSPCPGDHIDRWSRRRYQSLHEVARSIGADVSDVPLSPRDRLMVPRRRPAEGRRGRCEPNTRMVVINFPHNPTGAHIEPYAETSRRRSSAVCRTERGIVLFSDEVYRLLEHDPADAPSSRRHPLRGRRASASASCRSRSRWPVSASAGSRLAIARLLDERSRSLKDYTTICSSDAERSALIALRARDQVHRPQSRAITDGEPRPPRRLLRAPGQRISAGSGRAGGSIGFPELTARHRRRHVRRRTCSTPKGVLLAPGSLFGHPGNHFRLGFGRAGFGDGLARFEAYVEPGDNRYMEPTTGPHHGPGVTPRSAMPPLG